MQLPESFWAETNSCFRHLRYYGGYKGLVVCYKGKGCNGKHFNSYHQLPQANIVTVDVRNDYNLKSINNLKLFKRLGIIKRMNWKEYQSVIYRLLLNPCPSVINTVQSIMSRVPLQQYTVSSHIRCAGALANYKETTQMVKKNQLAYVSKVIRSEVSRGGITPNKTVFIATDSSYALTKITSLLYPIRVYSNEQVQRGHSTGAKRNIVHFTLIDLFLLTRSKTFIGVSRSGFSHVAAALSRAPIVRWLHV